MMSCHWCVDTDTGASFFVLIVMQYMVHIVERVYSKTKRREFTAPFHSPTTAKR